MIVNDWFRLFLYIVASIVPIWTAFFTTSTDYSLRGLLLPTLASANAATVVMLARTKGKVIDGPAEVAVAKGESITVTETAPSKVTTK